MDPPPPPPSSTVAEPLPPLPPSTPKLRLMCSYGGHIVPRPHDKSLCYVGGETRIVGVDRRTTAASLATLTAHFSRTLFNNRPFHLKYQLPNEELDSLISVTTDEDLQNMLEEHDRITAAGTSSTPSRIRLFLFPVKPESLGSTLLDPKSESWFSDALKSTRIVERGQSVDAAGLMMGLDSGVGQGRSDVEASQVESLSNPGAAAGESNKHVLEFGGLPESMVLETSSSFGSTSSSISMSNLPPIGVVQCEDGGVGLLEKKIRVPSSASLESDTSVASAGYQPKAGVYQEPLIQVASGVLPYTVEAESSISEPSPVIQMQKTHQVSGYHLSQQPDGKQHQPEVQYVHGGVRYVSQYPTGLVQSSSYYPVYQIPVQQQHPGPYQMNQPYPVYLVPVRPAQSYNMGVPCNVIDPATMASNRTPLHPQAAMITPSTACKDVLTAQPVPEAAPQVYRTAPAATAVVNAPSGQVQQLMGPSEPQLPPRPATPPSAPAANYAIEFDEDLAYTQIYKTQPSAPVLTSHYQTMTKGATVMLSESSVQLHMDNVKHPATSTAQ